MKSIVRKKVKKGTPQTKHRLNDDRAFTSYDTSRTETEDPQKVREASESAAEQLRVKKERSGKKSDRT